MNGMYRKRVIIKESSIQEHDRKLLTEFITRTRIEYGIKGVTQFEMMKLADKILHERR